MLVRPPLPDKPFRVARFGRADNRGVGRRKRGDKSSGLPEAYRRIRRPMPPPERTIPDERRRLEEEEARREIEEEAGGRRRHEGS